MRYLWIGLVGLCFASALLVSAALVIRYLPATPEEVAVENSAPAPDTAAPVETATIPVAKPHAAASESADAEATRAGSSSNSVGASVSSNAAEGEQIIAEFVATIPPPVPPSTPLDILPGGALNFRAMPPEATRQKPGQPAPSEINSTSSRHASDRLRLTPDQLEKVRDVLLSHTIMQSELEFPLRVGGTVPANIDLMPLPREVAASVPGYTNYSYVFTQNQLVIVITTSREIDLLIPA